MIHTWLVLAEMLLTESTNNDEISLIGM